MTYLPYLIVIAACFLLWPAAAQQLSARAQELGLTKTWLAPFPNSTDTDAPSFLKQAWFNPNNYFYGESDVSFDADPINGNDTVLKVLYAQGSYSPSGKKNNDGSVGGADFFAVPFNGSYDSALLSYQLAFDETFQWVQGGKLPGIYGGTATGGGCSGGNAATGSNCFSVRIMWRAAGSGEAYAYIPKSNNLCGASNVMCNDEYGVSFSRGIIRFQQKQWTKLEIYVKINDASQSNGILRVWQDGSLVINQQSIQYRTSNAIAASSLMFNTFFGGGSPSYATPVDTFTFFKNVEFSVGQPVELSDSASARTVVSCSLLGIAVVAATLFAL